MATSKRFARRVLPKAVVKVIASATGYWVSALGSPVVGLAGELATEKLLRWTIGQFCDTYREAEGTIFERELGGKDKLSYNSVSQFWTWIERDVAALSGKEFNPRHPLSFWAIMALSEKEKRKFAIPITVTGLLSPYGPLTPAHPMSRPGYSIQGWVNLGDLGVEDTEEYDTRDAIVYGDRVLRLSQPMRGKYYAGLYDAEFGISNVALPLYMDQSCLRGTLNELWQNAMSAGVWARIRGNLIAVPNFYALIEQTPELYKKLPSFGVEVTKIEKWSQPMGYTHISASVAWERSGEKMMTHYFNVQDHAEFEQAESLLQQAREKNSRVLQFDYDDEKYLSGRWKRNLPKYNEMLAYLLSK
ncbi:MAG: hypothetical protein HYX80_03360 [Chloroflexi bacterium]|nr:hypothetical protein [Chloroflexota bacterium]